MNITLTKIGAMLLCTAGLSLADGGTLPVRMATEKSVENYDLALRGAAKPADSTTRTTSNSEVFSNITIVAGKSYVVQSTMDYTSAAAVAVTLQCTACNSTTSSLASSGLVLQASWTVPNATSYVVAENKLASTFLYTDVGAALFNVYGSQFQLILQNKGTNNISIQQVTLFRQSQ
jgi:hypothetical protein